MARSRRKRGSEASGRPGLSGFELWARAMRWQRAVDRALAPLDLTHTQYWVLQTTRYLQDEVHDNAVTQQQIADAAELDKATTSYLCRKLEDKGLLDRGDTYDDRRAWRVVVTSKARRLLAKAGPLVAGVARKS